MANVREMDKGRDMTILVTVTTEPDGKGDPEDLTGWTLSADFKLNPDDVSAQFSKTTPTQIVLDLTGLANKARIYLEPADTSSLSAPLTLWFDVKGVEPGGEVRTVVKRQQIKVLLPVTT